MNLSANDIQVWMQSPVTRWIIDELEKEHRKIEARLKKERFSTLEEVTSAQTELRSLEKWIVQPEQRLKQLLNQRSETAED